MYVANHFIRANGTNYVRGECITDLTPEQVDWLLEARAISVVALASEEEPAAVTREEVTEEADDDAEAPEIDVMAGIVTDAEEQKPKRTRRKTK
ncbi:MAG: hypothetical protein Q4B09_05340 [Lachnospiraceae bacterium]|nr:hypothetical protein [Lachnospiraceae bacterium]